MSKAHRGMRDRVHHITILVLIFSYVLCFGMVINHRKPLRLPQSWQNNCLRIGFYSFGSKEWWRVNWTAFTHLRKKTFSLVFFRVTFWIKLQRAGEVSSCESSSLCRLRVIIQPKASLHLGRGRASSHWELAAFPPWLCCVLLAPVESLPTWCQPTASKG